MKKTVIALVVGCGIFAVGLAETAEAGRRLSGSEIRALFRGNLIGYYQETRKISVKATRTGGLLAWFEGKVDSGTWKIVGNKVCVTFKVWTSGKPKCRYVEREGGWYYAVKENGKSKVKFRR